MGEGDDDAEPDDLRLIAAADVYLDRIANGDSDISDADWLTRLLVAWRDDGRAGTSRPDP